jgi:flagellar protein FliO/FliZ
MSVPLNAILMLAATLAGFVALARLLQAMRGRFSRPDFLRWGGRLARPPAPPARLAVEQACMVDGKRRLVLVRCDGQRVLLLTGGPTDLVILSAPPAP